MNYNKAIVRDNGNNRNNSDNERNGVDERRERVGVGGRALNSPILSLNLKVHYNFTLNISSFPIHFITSCVSFGVISIYQQQLTSFSSCVFTPVCSNLVTPNIFVSFVGGSKVIESTEKEIDNGQSFFIASIICFAVILIISPPYLI